MQTLNKCNTCTCKNCINKLCEYYCNVIQENCDMLITNICDNKIIK